MLPIFGCAPHIGLFLSICCWQQFLEAGGPTATTQKTSENAECTQPKTTNGIFSILRDENRVVEGWGGAAQLWAGKKLCSSNPSKFTQKKISDRAHPHHRENDTSKSAILGTFKLKIEFA